MVSEQMSGQFGGSADDVELDIFNIGGDDGGTGSDRATEDRIAREAIRGLPSGQQPDTAPPQGNQPQGTQETADDLIARLTKERDEAARQRDGFYHDLKRTRGQPQPQPQQPGQQKAPLADRLFTDTPEALEEIQQSFAQQIATVELKHSLDRANDRAPEKFPEAFDAFMQQVGTGQDANTYFRIMRAPDQGREIMAWFQEQSVLREVQDPSTYREKAIADHMASLGLNPDGSPLGQTQSGVPAIAATRTADGKFAPREARLPPSPGRMAGSAQSARGEDGSDEAIWEAGSKGKK